MDDYIMSDSSGDRRSGKDRREAQIAFEGEDRRKSNRRLGEDRRRTVRRSGDRRAPAP